MRFSRGIRIGERATCPSLGSPDGVAPDSEARHMSSGRGPYNAPLLTCRFCPGRMGGAFSSAFCVSSSVSEVLGFSASNTRVRDGDCIADFISIFPFTLGTFSIPAFSSLCLLCGCFWLIGQATCDWESVLVSRAFSGGLWGRVFVFYCWHSAMQVPFQPHSKKCLRTRTPLASGCLGYRASRETVFPNHSLVLPGTDKRGRVVEWVEKASFDRLNKLFEITATEKHHQTLLAARNLLAVVREPQTYVINILPRKLPKKVVPGEHFVLKDLPFYKEVRKADAQARRARLTEREERRQEGTLRKAPGDKRSASSPPAGAPAERRRRFPQREKQ
ncbi:hypothetical protein AAG906_020751 [Vitis piasezkii]